MYRSEHIQYCTYLYIQYVQDTYTIAHIVLLYVSVSIYVSIYEQNTHT